mmetsp:Transcript_17322/g.27548  ORF Transcript_17322/g.27548 Transcript_17322/m.27548 type:complete len:97 (-) Transcript_17322:348-638(-)
MQLHVLVEAEVIQASGFYYSLEVGTRKRDSEVGDVYAILVQISDFGFRILDFGIGYRIVLEEQKWCDIRVAKAPQSTNTTIDQIIALVGVCWVNLR